MDLLRGADAHDREDHRGGPLSVCAGPWRVPACVRGGRGGGRGRLRVSGVRPGRGASHESWREGRGPGRVRGRGGTAEAFGRGNRRRGRPIEEGDLFRR
ncbi:MAG: hypothetical protein F4X00_16125 [Gemmatimonadetes bacterium]|nr:hypothetical protein [Gemmatimonadota bacterium]